MAPVVRPVGFRGNGSLNDGSAGVIRINGSEQAIPWL